MKPPLALTTKAKELLTVRSKGLESDVTKTELFDLNCKHSLGDLGTAYHLAQYHPSSEAWWW